MSLRSSGLELPPIQTLFEDPFATWFAENRPSTQAGSKCEIKFVDARYNAKGTKVFLHGGTKRSFDPTDSMENFESALVETKYYDTDGDLDYIETEIKSPHIKDALVEVVAPDYPDMETKADKLIMHNFKQCLFYYQDELREYGKQLDNADAAKHLNFALQYLYKELAHEIKIFKTNVEGPGTPRLDFLNLWMAFRPGELVHVRVDDTDVLLRIRRTRLIHSCLLRLQVTLQSFAFDGSIFGYKLTHYHITGSSCPGFTQLKDLKLRPIKYIPESERAAITKNCLARGKRFVELSRAVHYCQYDGLANFQHDGIDGMGEHNQPRMARTLVYGRVMVDGKQFSLEMPDSTACVQHSHETYDSKDCRAIPETDLVIASTTVMGFSFSHKKWLFLRVEAVVSIQFNENAFDQLLLPPAQKGMVKALVSAHERDTLEFDDIIQNKGKGMTMLLHGVPGVGKTLTAESIAEHLKRPLYTVTAGDFADNVAGIEAKLKNLLDLACHWNAVLLIDEADVFLEQRNSSDLRRNGIVSVFLRVLEYFSGVLILTTNRVKTIDTAFQSRIHLGIKYHPLSPENRRELWQLFITKAVGENLSWVDDETLDTLSSHVLNGREIKNVVRMAYALAIDSGEPLNLLFLTQAVEAMALFGREMDQEREDANEHPKTTDVAAGRTAVTGSPSRKKRRIED